MKDRFAPKHWHFFLITWQINLSPFYSYFVLPQPKLHLPQCWGSPHVRSQWGADHWTTSSADASYTPSTAASAPAQPHISGLLCLSPGNGGGKLSGGRKDGGTGPGNSTASRHGVLPELPSPLPGKFFSITPLMENSFIYSLTLWFDYYPYI